MQMHPHVLSSHNKSVLLWTQRHWFYSMRLCESFAETQCCAIPNFCVFAICSNDVAAVWLYFNWGHQLLSCQFLHYLLAAKVPHTASTRLLEHLIQLKATSWNLVLWKSDVHQEMASCFIVRQPIITSSRLRKPSCRRNKTDWSFQLIKAQGIFKQANLPYLITSLNDQP